MTQEEIIEMARQAGICSWLKPPKDVKERLKVFAKLVAAKEREAFEKICDEVINSDRDDHNDDESYKGYDDGWFDACNTLKFFVKKRGEA